VRVLVTGITGFVGRWLAPRLLADGHELAGLAIGEEGHSELPEAVALHDMDLSGGRDLASLLQGFRPEAVVHLAAQSAPSISLGDPAATFRANVTGTLNLLEVLRRAAPAARLLFVSSSEVYGLAGAEPLGESAPIRPVNPYGASKAAGEILVGQYARAWKIPAMVVRSFPHAGPGQRPLFALPAFARQIARIEAGRQEPVLRVGNLEAQRDYTDVEDVADAYARLLERGEPGETYNLCSGEVRSIRDSLDMLLSLTEDEIEVVTDTELLRPLDLHVLRGDNEKIRNATGWSPKIPFSVTIERVLADWRRRTSEEEAS